MRSKIEVHDFNEEGYKKLFHFEEWRIAILNYIEELEPLNIKYVEAHNKTDETFVLLEGNCILYLCDVLDGEIKDIQAVNLEKSKIYNIKKGVFHTHVLSKNAKLLVVENENTSDINSPKINLNQDQQMTLYSKMKQIWK